MLRLWNSRDVYEAATGLRDGPSSSQNSDSTLHSTTGDNAITTACLGIHTVEFDSPCQDHGVILSG